MFGLDFVSLIIPAFISGLVTFLAPCTLPLVPGYLGFISGTTFDDLKDPDRSRPARFKIFINGLFFVAGFSLVFIGLGVLAGLIGVSLGRYQIWLARIGGIFVILFGLFMMNVFKINFLSFERRFKLPSIFKPGKASNSMILGAAFGFGWTPCVGPILGSILLLASTSATVFEGAILLAIFSLGLALPFLILAVGIAQAALWIRRIGKYLNIISFVGGLFLVFLGILMLTNSFGIWTGYFFQLLGDFGYDNILNLL